MPTYEYACPKCGHEFEQFQSMRDEPLKKCPKCKKPGVKRLVGEESNVAVVISADRSVKYETVVKVMDSLQRAGIARVGLSVQLAP